MKQKLNIGIKNLVNDPRNSNKGRSKLGYVPAFLYFRHMERQKQILEIFKNREVVLSKSQIKEMTGISYYCNTDKHLGDILGRMVNNGLLERVKKGYFKWTGATVPNHRKNQIIIPKEQTQLF